MSIHAVHVVDIDTCVTVTSPATKGDVVNYHMADGTAAGVDFLWKCGIMWI